MTGRGRPSKEKCPVTKSAKRRTRPEDGSLPGCPGKNFAEEKQDGTTKEKASHTDEEPSVQGTGERRTRKHVTEEMDMQQRTPANNSKAPVQGTKAKTCTGRAKTVEQSAEEIPKMQQETPKDTTGDHMEPAKTKKCSRKEKCPVTKSAKRRTRPEDGSLPGCPGKNFAEEKQDGTTKEKANHTDEEPSLQSRGERKTRKHVTEEMDMQQRTPAVNSKAPVQGTKAKTCTGRAKTVEQSAEVIPKMQQETPKDTTGDHVEPAKTKKCSRRSKDSGTAKAQQENPGRAEKPRVAQHECGTQALTDNVLYKTLEKLRIKKNDRANASAVVNNMIKDIIWHLKQKTECFQVGDPLRTGSYYENVKISNPDEFDVMLPVPVDRVIVTPFRDDGAFYSVTLKRSNSPLWRFQETVGGSLSSSKMLIEFRKEVKTCVKAHKEWEVIKKKKGCPAVTLTTVVQSVEVSLDIVLCLMVKSSWPPFAKDGFKIEGWLGTKVRKAQRLNSYYLVPKYEGQGTVTHDGVLTKDVWRVSFSHVEKAILQNHGSQKTCCEKEGERCCRKDCLKLLKHLLNLLKEKDPSFEKFYSYHAKTTLLHACCSRADDSDWRASSLRQCFQLLLDDFVGHLEKGVLPNFFIPNQNLLSHHNQMQRESLARRIREECDNGFPIFRL